MVAHSQAAPGKPMQTTPSAPRRKASSAENSSGQSPSPSESAVGPENQPGAPEGSAEPARDPERRDDGIGAVGDHGLDDPAGVAERRPGIHDMA